jgi:hypothetical protein
MNKVRNLKPWMGFYLTGVLAIHGLVFWNARELVKKGYPDFAIYYTAGTMVRSGMGGRLYDEAAQFRVQQQFAQQVTTRQAALPFNHPPFEALLFVPFSLLSYRAAYFLWLFMNLAILAVLPGMLREWVPMLGLARAWVWMAAELGFFPIFFALLQGQDAILLLFFYALAFVSLKRGRFAMAGVWLACGLFKFHLVLPFLVLLLAGQMSFEQKKRIAGGFGLAGGTLILISLLVAGARQMMFYPRYVLGLESTMAQGAIRPSDMPNLRGMVGLLAGKLAHAEGIVLLISAVLFLLALWIVRLPEISGDSRFALALLVTVLVSYHCLGYDLCVLMIAVLLLAGRLRSDGMGRDWTRMAMIAGVAGLLFSPLQALLLMRYSQLGWMGWAVLCLAIGVMAEMARGHRVMSGARAQ